VAVPRRTEGQEWPCGGGGPQIGRSYGTFVLMSAPILVNTFVDRSAQPRAWQPQRLLQPCRPRARIPPDPVHWYLFRPGAVLLCYLASSFVYSFLLRMHRQEYHCRSGTALIIDSRTPSAERCLASLAALLRRRVDGHCPGARPALGHVILDESANRIEHVSHD
jgi:hypothetical protein